MQQKNKKRIDKINLSDIIKSRSNRKRGENKMWISKKQWDSLNKRVSALERAEQERIVEKENLKKNGSKAIEEAEKITKGSQFQFVGI